MVQWDELDGDRSLTPEQIADLVDRHGMHWVDQYNQALLLTVQALQALHIALDAKFARGEH